tara:strand:- start:792 stop:1412 length:621 start_codon:yes stop_codon:yes gene_type:complete
MIIAGLTGSIGMGKSTTARLFAEAGIPVFDADATVHALYAEGGAAVTPIRKRFPGSVSLGAVDRVALLKHLQANASGFADLEAIVHPLVAKARADFIAKSEAEGARLAIFDIPLLFETGQADAYDVVIVVSAPASVQAERVLSRPGMTEEKFAAILERQVPDADKRARADYIIDSSTGLDDARRQVIELIETLIGPPKQTRTPTDA